ncbi:hypothetical protein HMF7854_01710 [Sphingomonas ginkgonis]|uniref:Glycosyltransferase RgtA/B/C/D-like domain-containing protein n=2 Tax=Sphingomonas ginkgonis TaxID=2315330 RepID=A0A429V6V9_9SPHN|nr:hypothetical protein HMF7854_01710 [Sphingomonas ginkgonis]
MNPPAPIAATVTGPRPWWETRPFVVFLILLSTVPLLYPTVPPLVDLPAHMGRYRVALAVGHPSPLAGWYGYDLKLIGNLGVDLLVYPLAKLIGLEAAVKLIILSIPAMTVAGMLWVAREVHHRLPPTVLFAIPFAYSYPFLFGFVNFALSMALAFLAFGFWLRLARKRRFRLRLALFAPISCVVWVAHTFGWGVLGLLAFSAEAVRQHDEGRPWWQAAYRAALQAACLALPVVMMLLWRSSAGGSTIDFFAWSKKLQYLNSILRDRWIIWDQTSAALVGLLLFLAIVVPKLTFSRNLAFSTLLLAAAFIVLPRMIFGSAYADMRLAPFAAAIAVLAIRFKRETDLRLARTLAFVGLAFVLARTATVTTSLAMAGFDQQAKLAALDHVPRYARVVSLVSRCGQWALTRNDHLPSMVTVRREGFSNDQWVMEGGNPLTIHYPQARPFDVDESELVAAQRCARHRRTRTLDTSIPRIPAGAFDYLWLIDPGPFDTRVLRDWQLVWSGPGSFLYRYSAART